MTVPTETYGRRHWLLLLIAFSAVSIAANVAHAARLTDGDALSMAVAAIAPAALLGSTHALVLFGRHFPGWRRGALGSAVAVVGLAAFTMSFAALTDLAVMTGTRPALAPFLPVAVDVAIVIFTAALVMANNQIARDRAHAEEALHTGVHAVHDAVQAPVHAVQPTGSERSAETVSEAGVHTVFTQVIDDIAQPRAQRAQPLHTGVHAVHGLDRTADLDVRTEPADEPFDDAVAHPLHTRAHAVHAVVRPSVTVDVLAEALARREAGESLRAVAEAAGVSPNTVKKWTSVAANLAAQEGGRAAPAGPRPGSSEEEGEGGGDPWNAGGAVAV